MFYSFIRTLAWPVAHWLFSVRYEGTENIRDMKGPYIIICNHFSYGDPIVVALATRRKVHFMAKAQLFRHKLLGWFIRCLNAFPVDRDKSDLSAIKHAFKVLREGQVLGIFPEGTRSKTDDMLPFLSGAALIALKTDVPVVPIAIKAKYGPFRKNRCTIGKPFFAKDLVPEGAEKANLAETVSEAMRNMILEMRG